MNEELILNDIENNKNEYINFLKKLINTNSYNPPGNEKDIAIKIKKYLEKENIKIEIFSFGGSRANLIAYLNNNFDRKNLLYNGHMDTVPPNSENEWNNPPLSGYIENNKLIYGRGATDMKGGLAAMVISLKILRKLGIKLSGNLILNAVAEEETGGSLGTKWCLENKLKIIKCDFAVVGEPSSFYDLSKSIVLGEKGSLQIKIITKGISCHSSTPFLGKNAICMMSNIIRNLNKIDNFFPKIKLPISKKLLKDFMSLSFKSNKMFKKALKNENKLKHLLKSVITPIKSVTMINGGIKENIIPDKCEAIIDFRILPGHTEEMVLNALKKLILNLGYPIKNDSITEKNIIYVILEVFNRTEASFFKNWQKSKVLKNFYNIVQKVYGNKPFYYFFPGGSDAEFYRNNNYCHETIIFGPGKYEGAHCVNENLDIEDYINAIKVYTLFAYNFLK